MPRPFANAEQLADNLAAQSEIEEKLLYPTAYFGDLKEQLRQAVEEHLSMKRLLADLTRVDTSAKLAPVLASSGEF